VAIICSEQSQFKRRAIEVHDEYRKDPKYGNFDALAFASPKAFYPLQAADLVVNETYAYSDATHGRGIPMIREALRTMLESGLAMRGGYYDEDNLRELIVRGPAP
jgi:hypothetical protein